MERDYTTETEEELSVAQSQLNSYTFVYTPSTNNSAAYTTMYNKWNGYNSNDIYYYNSLFAGVSQSFQNVRNFDTQYATDRYRAEKYKSLEEFITTIRGIRDCISSSSYEGGRVDSIKYNNSIFGEGYASLVVSEGFEEAMLVSDSATAAKYFFNQIIKVNEDGSIDYDMDLITEIMVKSNDEINSGQYDAIALSYLYMSEEEMAQLMCLCTNKVEDVEYGFNLGIAAGIMNEDYSKWEVDKEKYQNLFVSMSELSNNYLILCYDFKQEYEDTEDATYEKLLTEYEQTRKDLNQKMALWGAFGTIDELHGEFKGDKPIINIESKKFSDSLGDEYIFTFAEYRNVSTSLAPVFSNFGTSTITVGPCLEGREISLYQASLGENTMINQFVPGFTSSGYEDGALSYHLQHMLMGAGDGLLSEAIFNSVHDGFGYGNVVVQAVYGSLMDYQAGVEGATVIEESFDDIYVSIMYDSFEFHCTPVTFDTGGGHSYYQYAQPGTTTIDEIQEYNDKTGENLSVYEILFFPEQSADGILNYYGFN